MAATTRELSLFDRLHRPPAIGRASASFPRAVVRNPVMFVVEVGAV
jgi:high-affinity K+ transport system ATPase subunit B